MMMNNISTSSGLRLAKMFLIYISDLKHKIKYSIFHQRLIIQDLIFFFSHLTKQNVWHDKYTVGQLIVTVKQNVRCNKHFIGQKQ